MQYSKLGKSEIQISKLGFGCWASAKSGWKDVNIDQAYETLKMAYSLGINFFDTAPVYGFGKSEEMVGEVLKDIRDKVVIATKFGLRWSERGTVIHDISPDSMMFELEASLKRLNTDYIDLYQIHWPDNKTDIKSILSKLGELKNSGTIRAVGVSNFSFELLKQSVDYLAIDSVQEKYNYLERRAESEILPFCAANSISFIAYSPLAQGILSGKVKENYTPSKNDIRRFNPLLKDSSAFETVNNLGKNPAKTALDFLFSNSTVSSAIVSMTKPDHLIKNCSYIKQG